MMGDGGTILCTNILIHRLSESIEHGWARTNSSGRHLI
jgi:hypothetical protein